jgi:hypothetical protein
MTQMYLSHGARNARVDNVVTLLNEEQLWWK